MFQWKELVFKTLRWPARLWSLGMLRSLCTLVSPPPSSAMPALSSPLTSTLSWKRWLSAMSNPSKLIQSNPLYPISNPSKLCFSSGCLATTQSLFQPSPTQPPLRIGIFTQGGPGSLCLYMESFNVWHRGPRIFLYPISPEEVILVLNLKLKIDPGDVQLGGHPCTFWAVPHTRFYTFYFSFVT